MEKKSLKQLFHEVDPNLKVVTGHHGVTKQEWLASTGEICIVCHREFQQGRDHMCMRCWNEKQDATVEIRDKTGITDLYGPEFLAKITHKSKNEE
jgi:hypothetical protein